MSVEVDGIYSKLCPVCHRASPLSRVVVTFARNEPSLDCSLCGAISPYEGLLAQKPKPCSWLKSWLFCKQPIRPAINSRVSECMICHRCR